MKLHGFVFLAENPNALQSDAELAEPKQNAKMVIRRLNRNSEPQASIEAGQYTLQSVTPLLPICVLKSKY